MPIDPAIPRATLLIGELSPMLRAIAFALADAGFSVALRCAKGLDEAEQVAHDVTRRGVGAIVLTGGQPSGGRLGEGRDLIDAARAVGPVGVLVINAIGDDLSAVALAESVRFFEGLEPDAKGAIVMMLDQRALTRDTSAVPEALAQSAVGELTRRLALAFAPRVRVNAVALISGQTSVRQTPILSGHTRAGVEPDTDPLDFARAAMATLALSSMTGQILALGGHRRVQTTFQRHGS